MKYSLLITGGEVIDPANTLRGRYDVGLANGRIAAVAPTIPGEEAAKVLDATGKYVVPGLVDLHTHVYAYGATLGIDPDVFHPKGGVTTAVDAGTTGVATFRGFERFVIEPAKVRVLAFLHVACTGLTTFLHGIGELTDMRHAMPEQTARMILDTRETLIGVKVRMSKNYVGDFGVEPLRAAVRAAEMAGVPVMVHIAGSWVTLKEILAELRPGDIVTHAYHGNAEGIVDKEMRVLPEVWEAKERGILFDIGHGSGSFHYPVACAALDQGFVPDSISTDLYVSNVNGPVYDMITTVSKLIDLGMPLEDAITKSTTDPARFIGWEREIGHLGVGAEADVAVLEMVEGEFEFFDCRKEKRQARRRLQVVTTIKGGKIIYQR
jgi:dihydroorotase